MAKIVVSFYVLFYQFAIHFNNGPANLQHKQIHLHLQNGSQGVSGGNIWEVLGTLTNLPDVSRGFPQSI
jgi:hypothetical protein